MLGKFLLFKKLEEATKHSKDDIKRGRATVWGAAAGTGNYLVMKNAGEFITSEVAPRGKRYNVKADKLKQTVNRAYKDMGGKGAPPKVRLGDLGGPAGIYRPLTHAIKLPLRDLPTKKVINNSDYVDKVLGDKTPSFKRFKEMFGRGVASHAMGQKTGTAQTRLHHIYHEVGHSVTKRNPLRIAMSYASRATTPVGIIAGAKIASKDKDKRAPLKGAAIGAALSSGTLAGEVVPEVRIYKMLKKRGIKPIKAAKWVAKHSARNLGFAATKPLAIGAGVGAAGNTYRYLMNKKKPIKESALMEVTQDLVISILMNSKKKPNAEAMIRGARILKKMSLKAAKEKGIKAGIAKNVDAVVHMSRHPKVKKVLDVINSADAHDQGIPIHPINWLQ